MRGFVRDILSLASWGCAFFVAKHYHTSLSMSAHFMSIKNELIRNLISIAVLFILTLIVGTIVTYTVNQLIEKSGMVGINRILGIFFGMLRGILIVIIILFFLNSFPLLGKEDWQRSYLIPYFNFIMKWSVKYLESFFSFLFEM